MKLLFVYVLLIPFSFITCATTEHSPSASLPSTPLETIYFSETNSTSPGSVCFFKINKEEIIGRKVIRSYPDSSPLLADVIRELLDGPTDLEKEEGLVSLIPSGAKLLSCSFRGLTLHLNLSENFLYNKNGSLGYELQLMQIIETLKEFPIEEVQFLIEGKRVDYLGEEKQIGSPLPVNPGSDDVTWLIEQKAIEEKRQKIIKEEYGKFVTERRENTPVLIFLCYTEKPNSASGVSCSIRFTNISDKRIKYVYFTVTPYNRVDDIAYSEIGNLSTTEIEVVHFINPDEFYHAKWENVWYNSTIAYMKIVGIRIIFDDNGILTISDKDGLDKALLTPEEYITFRRLFS
jgi:hypothetical protein